jgi:apolipoprotein N-acyltransferase
VVILKLRSEVRDVSSSSRAHPVRLKLAVLAVSAAALNLAFSPFPLRFLALVALVPLLWITDTESPGRAFRYGLFFGAVFFAAHLWWLYTLVVPVEHVTRILLDVGVTLLFAYLGLYVALFALAARYLGLLWSPFIWTALEWIRSQSDAGFPWGLLGTSLTTYTPMIQGASTVGVYGISALVVLINLLVYKSIRKGRRALFVPLLVASIAVPFVSGLIRMKHATPWFQVGVIQPNVSPVDKGARTSREEIWRGMLELSRDAAASGAQVLLYPETATLVDITREGSFRDALRALADSANVAIVTGTPLYGDYGYANATTVFEPNRPLGQFYAKVRLAPFSEHFPFVDRVPVLRRLMTGDMGDCTPGRTLKVFEVGEIRYSTPICYEGIFPEQIRRFVASGAQVIMVVTNDGWFGRTPGPYQHCELMIMRAVENGVPLIRAANNGVSLVADPYGRILKNSALFVGTQFVQEVPRPLSPTIYTRTGDLFSFFSLALVALLIAIRVITVGSEKIRQHSTSRTN